MISFVSRILRSQAFSRKYCINPLAKELQKHGFVDVSLVGSLTFV